MPSQLSHRSLSWPRLDRDHMRDGRGCERCALTTPKRDLGAGGHGVRSRRRAVVGVLSLGGAEASIEIPFRLPVNAHSRRALRADIDCSPLTLRTERGSVRERGEFSPATRWRRPRPEEWDELYAWHVESGRSVRNRSCRISKKRSTIFSMGNAPNRLQATRARSMMPH